MPMSRGLELQKNPYWEDKYITEKKYIKWCYNIEIYLPPLLEVLDFIKNLLYNHSLSAKNYRQFICEYNTGSFFASMEAQFKALLGIGLYCCHVNDQISEHFLLMDNSFYINDHKQPMSL